MSVAGRAIVPFTGSYDGLIKGAEQATESVAAKFRGLLAPVGVFGAAVAGAGAAVLTMAAKYQKSTDQFAANANLTIKQAQRIGTAFLATGGQTTFTAQEMLAALVPVSGELRILNGGVLSTAQELSFMRAAMALAEATGGDLTSTVASLTNVMRAYNIPVALAASTTDILRNVSNGSGLTVDALATSVEKLKTKLGPLSPSLQDTSTLLLDLSDHGVSGTKGMNVMSGALTTLLGGSKKTEAEIKKLGLTVIDGHGNFVGLSSILEQLSPKLDTMTQKQRFAAEAALIGAGNVHTLDATLLAGLPGWDAAALAVTKTGTAQTDAAKATDNFSGVLDRLKTKVIDGATSLGQQLLPAATAIGTWILNTGAPAIETFGAGVYHWIETVVVPAFMHVESYIAKNVVPRLLDFVSAVRLHVLPVFVDFGTWIANHVVGPAVNLTQKIIPPLLDALTFVANHFSTIAGIVAPLAIALAAVWAVDKIKTWGATAMSTIEAVAAKFGALIGFGGASTDVVSAAGITKVWIVGADPGVLGIGAAGSAAGADLGGLEAGAVAGAAGKGGEAVYGRVAQSSLASTIGNLALKVTLIGAAALAIQQFAKAFLSRPPANNGQGYQFSFQGTKYNAQQLLSGTGAGNQGSPGLFGEGTAPLLNQLVNQDQLKKAQAAIAAIARSLQMSVPEYIAFQQAGMDLSAMAGKTAPQIGSGFNTLENHLTAMGLSFAQSASASDALQSYITKYGPLSSAQMLAFYDDVKHGATSAADIALSMQTINLKLQPGIDYVQRFSDALKAGLSPSRAAIVAKYSRAGGGPITEDVIGVGQSTGAVWQFHNHETVVTDSQLRGMAGRSSQSNTRQSGPATITQNHTWNITGLPQQIIAEVVRIVEQNNAELMMELQLG